MTPSSTLQDTPTTTPSEEPAPTPFEERAEAAFLTHIQAPDFPCVAAKAAVNTEVYRIGAYPQMCSPQTAAKLAADLRAFQIAQPRLDSGFTTFAAIFEYPAHIDELTFERLVWQQLSDLAAHDTAPYSTEVSPDPASPDYGYSFGGQAFFIVGMHPGASRLARRFQYPTLVFNSHHQFRALKADGRWARFQAQIRQRDEKLQGSLNPNLADFGTASEARQYSGRAVEADWQPPQDPAQQRHCPYHSAAPGPQKPPETGEDT